jgi:aryl-alcohol dehydrogenase-like predicted oxidoreductase
VAGFLNSLQLDGLSHRHSIARFKHLRETWNRQWFAALIALPHERLPNVRGLAAIAKKCGQTPPQVAIAWILRDSWGISALIGARTFEQLDDSLDPLKNLNFSQDELNEIRGWMGRKAGHGFYEDYKS